jgi:TolB-like protein/tetratricopeptide (TPR) repeat protein
VGEFGGTTLEGAPSDDRGSDASMTEASRAVFLSYASQDAAAARRICDALRAAAIEVWFDQSELRGGDVWDRQIRKQIRDCALFVPVISANSQARLEGYFRLEWRLAVERTHLMADAKPFLVPVVIDATSDKDAEVPDPFRAVQWTRLPAGETSPAFVERVSRLLSPEAAQASTEARSPAALALHAAVAPRQLTPSPAASGRTQRLLLVIAAVAVIGAGYVALDQFILSKRPVSAAPAPATASSPAEPAPSQINEKSIAVLPFIDMSKQKDQEYFSDGLAEELLDLLAKTPGLHVIARTSSFSFKGKSDDVPTIGRKLNVANILEGSVRKSGNRLRITTQLVRASSGEHLWSQTYDRELKDVFAVQDEIAGAVVAALKVQLSGPPATSPPPTSVPEAYDQFLLGRQLLQRGSDESFRQGIRAFQIATRLDPGFADAYANLALAEIFEAEGTNDTEGYQRARIAIERASALAPDLPNAYHARGLLRYLTLDLAGARADFERAISLAPSDSLILTHYGDVMASLGQVPEAVAAGQRAVALDPVNRIAWKHLGGFLIFQGNLPAARQALERALAISPESEGTIFLTGTVDLLEAQFADARVQFGKLPDPDLGDRLVGLALVEDRLGHADKSQTALDELIRYHSGYEAYNIATIYAWRGDKDRVFEWLDRAYQQHDSELVNVKVDPLLHGVRGDPRYKAFLRKMKLPE